MVPVVLRPYSGEILYSWLARTAAVYGVDHSDLLGFPATLWDLLAVPAPETLRRLAEFTRMPETALGDLTIAGTDLPQRWWSIRQITPDPFAPNMEYTYHPTITFCRLCLWNDFITDGNEYLRLKWMAAAPTICPLHRVPMEDICNFCSAWVLPISVRTNRGFRFVCAECKRPFASPQVIRQDNAISGDPNLNRVRSSARGRTPEREECAVSGRMDWSKGFLADGRGFVLVTHEKDGRKRPTICSSP
jgi:TniQ protein